MDTAASHQAVLENKLDNILAETQDIKRSQDKTNDKLDKLNGRVRGNETKVACLETNQENIEKSIESLQVKSDRNDVLSSLFAALPGVGAIFALFGKS